jgi:hypothetical protein
MSALVSGQELGQTIAKKYLHHLSREKNSNKKNKERKEILNS